MEHFSLIVNFAQVEGGEDDLNTEDMEDMRDCTELCIVRDCQHCSLQLDLMHVIFTVYNSMYIQYIYIYIYMYM